MQHADLQTTEESKAEETAEVGSESADRPSETNDSEQPTVGQIHVSSTVRECMVCGVTGLAVLCGREDCELAVHSWCAEQQQLSTNGDFVCPSHADLRKVDWKVQAPGRSQTVSSDSETVREFRTQYSEAHLGQLCTGTVFWYVLCAQYFPGLEVTRTPPNFRIHVGGYRPKDLLQGCGGKEGIWDLQGSLNSTLQQLSEVQGSIDALLGQLAAAQSAKLQQFAQFKCSGRTTDDEWVLKDVKLVELKQLTRCYLKYFERKERVVQPEVVTAFSRRPNPEDDFPCSICGDGDYEDDDPIVICEGCELGAHTKCYGIPAVPEGAWLCDMCKVFGPQAAKTLSCALCPVKGGLLKRTTHENDGSLGMHHYPKFEAVQEESPHNPKQMWVHVFCALRVPRVTVGNSDLVEGIHLERVEERLFRLKCEVCGSKEGACIKCAQKGCGAAFHPECGKAFFLFTGWKLSRSLENQIYCNQHRTFRLRKLIEIKERCAVNELSAFFRDWEKWIPKWRLQTSSQRVWTEEESGQLEEKVRVFLNGSYCGPAIPFTITLESSAPGVVVEMPLVCNLMEARVIVQRTISIPGRSPEECAKYYEKHLYPQMKKRLEDLGRPVLVLQGQKKHSSARSCKKSAASHEKASKRSHKSDSKKPEKRRELPLRPVVTTELFCVCKRPYVELLPKSESEDEESYQEKLRNYSMIQCLQCQQWFHLGCVQYPGSAEDAEGDESWQCLGCKASPAG